MEEIKNAEAPKPGTKEALKAENEALKAELEALKAKQSADTEGSAQDEEKEAPAPVAAQKKVKIKLPLSRTEKDDVFVGLNGKTYLIKRGVEVEVPEGVARILARKEKMLSIAMEYEAQAAAPLDELAKMYK